jgi:very-short-patch-repair endonuclease
MRRRFDKKIVDFVVYVHGSMRVLAIVELDDRTHDPEKDRVRDAMMAKGGFQTVRWDSRAKPSVQVIQQKFASLMAGVSV